MTSVDQADFHEPYPKRVSLSATAQESFARRGLRILCIGVLLSVLVAVLWVLLVLQRGVLAGDYETVPKIWLVTFSTLAGLTLAAVGASYRLSGEISSVWIERWHWILGILLGLTIASLFGPEFFLHNRWRLPEGFSPGYYLTGPRAFAILDTFILMVLVGILTSARALICVIFVGYGLTDLIIRGEPFWTDQFSLWDAMTYLQTATLALGGIILSQLWRAAEIGRLSQQEIARKARQEMRSAGLERKRAEDARSKAEAELETARHASAEAEEAREEAEEELGEIENQRRAVAAQNRRLEKLFSAVTHDVRTPLSTLSLQLSMMRGRPERTYNVEEIDSLLRITRRASEIIEYAVDPRSDPVAVYKLAEIIEPHMRDLERSANQSRLDLELDVAQVAVRTGRVRLALVVQNFLQNAIRYTGDIALGARGKVVIRTKSIGKNLIRLEVADKGPGIDACDLDRMWERGTQLNNSNRDGTKGYGQGLAIVREAVQSLDGHSCGVDSAPGKGSTFWIDIPLATIEEAETDYGVVKPTRLLDGMRIVILEDHVENRTLLARTLRGWGCEIVDGDTPEAILKGLNENSENGGSPSCRIPHLLIVDYNLLDNLNGLDAVPMLRSAIEKDVPAAIWTADASESLKKIIKSAGLYYLAKSREAKELAPLLNRVSDEWRAYVERS